MNGVLNRMLVCSLLFVCSPLVLANTKATNESIRIENPYVRLMPAVQKNTGAFMMLENLSDQQRSVIGAESNVANIVELHSHVHAGGMMRMQKVEKIDVPAQGKVELKPGSFHVMLIQLKKPLKQGQIVPITLVFDDQSRKLVQAPVRPIEPSK